MADVATLRVQFEGTQTIAGLKALQAEIRKTFEAASIGTRQQADAGKLLADVGNKLGAQRALALTDNAKMMKSYFSLGESLRGNTREMLALGESMGLSPHGLHGIIAGLSGGGGIPLLLGGLTAVVFAARSAAEDVKKLDAELMNLQGRGIEALDNKITALESSHPAWFAPLGTTAGGRTSILGELPFFGQEEKGFRVDLMTAIEARAKASSKGAIDIEKYWPTPGSLPLGIPGAPDEPITIKQRTENIRNETEALKKRTDEEIKEYKLLLERRKLSSDLFLGGTLFAQGQRPGGLFGVTRGGFGEQFQRGYAPTSGEAVSAAYANINVMPAGGTEETYKMAFPFIRKDPTMEAIKTGAIEAGQAISQYIGGSLTKSLDTGDQLALQLMKIAIIIAANAAAPGSAGEPGMGDIFGKILPFASGGRLYEPVMGRGLQTGRRYMFGENGPEDFTPARSSRQYGRANADGVIHVVVEGKISHRDIFFASYKGRQEYYQGVLK